jgi:hypothetical protein
VATTVPPFSELISAASVSAVHLEMRDAYTPDDPVFLDWLASGKVTDPAEPAWYDLVRAQVARGISFRRARVVSEPPSDFVRFEHECTSGLNIAAGEQVRWLPRRRASDLCLPGNDFWIFDSRLIRISHFAGNGDFIQDELSEDPALIKHCSSAFEGIWERGIDHADYQLT